MRQLTFLLVILAVLLVDVQHSAAQLILSPEMRNSLLAHLRVTNTGEETIHNLRVHFPNRTVAFGDVAPGATTPYLEVRGGVYSYAAYTYVYEGQRVNQPVTDWMGELPLPGTQFTYQLELDPARLPFPLRLLQYSHDSPQ